jgi:hypothetical protein
MGEQADKGKDEFRDGLKKIKQGLQDMAQDWGGQLQDYARSLKERANNYWQEMEPIRIPQWMKIAPFADDEGTRRKRMIDGVTETIMHARKWDEMTAERNPDGTRITITPPAGYEEMARNADFVGSPPKIYIAESDDSPRPHIYPQQSPDGTKYLLVNKQFKGSNTSEQSAILRRGLEALKLGYPEKFPELAAKHNSWDLASIREMNSDIAAHIACESAKTCHVEGEVVQVLPFPQDGASSHQKR